MLPSSVEQNNKIISKSTIITQIILNFIPFNSYHLLNNNHTLQSFNIKYSMTATSTKQRSIFLTFFITMFLLIVTQQQSQPPIIKVTLMQNLTASQLSNTYQYYQLTFKTTKKLLLLTLNLNSSATVSIYISTHFTGSNQVYYTHPNQTTYTQECDQSSFDTCIVRFDGEAALQPKEVTVYFSIYAYGDVGYDLWAVIDQIYNLDITTKYRIDFSKYESGVLKLSGDQFVGKEEVVMVMSYNTSGLVGKFKTQATIDQIPNSVTYGKNSITGITVGAFNKILKLQPIDVNSSYFVLIQGQKGTKFNLYFYDSTPSAPSIAINSTVIYQTSKGITYLAHTAFANTQIPLFIKLDAYSGYGIFNISYCNGFINNTFQNINGQNGQIAITVAQRKKCKQKMGQGSFGLLVQNIQIDITNVYYHFGFEIGIYQGSYDHPLRLGQQKFGVFINNEKQRTYPIQILYVQEEISIRFQQITETQNASLSFQLQACFRKRNVMKCQIIMNNQNQQKGDISFIPQPEYTYNLIITCANCTNSTSTIQYLVLLQNQYEKSHNIVPFRLYVQQVQNNQYNFYVINLTRIADQQKIVIVNNSLLTINIKQINGDVYTLMSFTIPNPTYDKYLNGNYTDQIIFSWNGTIKYLLNETAELIYVSVKGNEESLFYLQYTIDIDADIPAKYTRILDGTQNNFLLNKNNPYQLISFTSHIIPYKVYITNKPKCIKMGSSLPLNQNCLNEIPDQLTNKVIYFNISNGNNPNNFKFNVYVNTGEIILNDRESILIGCPQSCYQLVTVQLEHNSNVIHEGRGQIYEVKNVNNIAYNSFLPLKCQTYPCSIKINATLPYGGQMSLFLQNSGIRQIEWTASPITFGDYPKKFIFQLRPWSEMNSILIYSQALQLDVYYNIINIHETQTNIKSYKFPFPDKYDGMQIGNPLRKVQVVTIDEKLISKKGCRGASTYCLVAFSLYPNLQIQYNEDYFNSGIGYISSNTYQYYFPLNIPYEMNQQFSMSYFAHRITVKQKQKMNSYRINIQPLSNCHPKLYISPNDVNPTFEKPNYDDVMILNGSNWINFTVLAEDYCKYKVTLTNSLYQTISQNKYYHFNMDKPVLFLLFRSQYSRHLGFKIQVETDSIYNKVNYIAVNKVNQSSDYVEPVPQSSDFKTLNTYSLDVPQNQTYNLYLIAISTNSSNIQLIIRKDDPIILTRNQQDKQQLKPSHILSYQIHSTGSIALFATTSQQYALVTVNKNYNQTEVKRSIITIRSQPWIYINTTSRELTTYDITIRNSGNVTTTIKILFQLNDILSYQRIYQGIVSYDAFITKNEKNCFYFVTPILVGRKTITVDLVIGKNNTQFVQLCKTSPEDCAKLLYIAYTKDSIVQSTLKIIQSIPRVYRLILQFIPNQNYTICYYTPSLAALNIEYYVLLNQVQMEHLIQDYTHLQTSENQYDMYEIVEQGYNENIMIEITSCLTSNRNQKILVGSASFLDSSMGRYTDLVNFHKTQNSIYAKLQVEEGYYYLGVKNVIYNNPYANAYTIRFQNITDNGPLLATKWELQDSKIVKVYSNDDNNTRYHIQLPELVSNSDDLLQKNLTIRYTIMIQNFTKQNSTAIPLDMYARCPTYLQSLNTQNTDLKIETPVVTSTLNFTYDNLTHYRRLRETPSFSFDTSQLPKIFNISGKIEVSADSQSFTFYYENSQINLNNLNKSDGISPIFIVLIVFIAVSIAGLGIYVLWSYIKLKKNKQIEMTEFNQAMNSNRAAAETPPLQALTGTTKREKRKQYRQFEEQLN